MTREAHVESCASQKSVSISLRGIHPELGQTLASTGLTVWRGAEEVARFMWEHRCVDVEVLSPLATMWPFGWCTGGKGQEYKRLGL